GGFAAAVVVATPAAAAEPQVNLWDEYQRLSAECDGADTDFWDALRKRPEAPACICKRGGINPATAKPYLVPLDPEELQERFEDDVKWRGKASADRSYGPLLRPMEEWQAACEASDQRYRVAELSAKVDDLFLR